jgi:hypothetical protein
MRPLRNLASPSGLDLETALSLAAWLKDYQLAL